MRKTNFTACAALFLNNATLQNKYGYNGSTHLIDRNWTTQITLEGCKSLCGEGHDWYPWSQSSSTITTWILPVIGMLLQAPFVSNAFWKTVFAIARWAGSPMASLSYILWNIKVSGQSALMVDMAIPYEGSIPEMGTDFADIRDSFYLLMNMNQYTMKPIVSLQKEAEGLLRIALFSKDLRLRDTQSTLHEIRREMAQDLREGRKRGVVPVFISTMWFVFSLAISIQAAFGYIGSNATAHNLALGLLLGWLPVLILCSIVDRNPVAADDIRRRLNEVVDKVCDSLQDEDIRHEYIQCFAGQRQASELREWVDKISTHSEFIMRNYFVEFAGQGRIRWHYGAAHPILSDIEKCYVAARGRNWLENEEEARTHLVLGDVDEGLVWFDFRELWQITSAIIFVSGTCFGAFILSYYTPTVGLGCRAGGYLIFACISLSLLIAEFLVWWLASPVSEQQMEWLAQRTTRMQSSATVARFGENSTGVFRNLKSRVSKSMPKVETALIHGVLSVAALIPWGNKEERGRDIRRRLEANFDACRDYTLKEWTDRFLFKPVECINMIWLAYIVLAQTFGLYNTCVCETSAWGLGGHYIDFLNMDLTKNKYVVTYWAGGTATGVAIMGFGLIYVVTEWCLQAHLSTSDYEDARKGLRRTRRFRRATFFIRYPADLLIAGINKLFKPRTNEGQRSLVWTKGTKFRATFPRRMTVLRDYSAGTAQHRGSEDAPLIIEPEAAHPFQRFETESHLSPSARNSPRLSSDSSPPSPSDDFLRPRPVFPRQWTDQSGRGSSP